MAAILARATEADPARTLPSGDSTGLTLAALQDIGREVGISPEAIAHAALSLEQGPATSSKSFLGFPIGVGRQLDLGRPINDADWERLVADLRVTFEARGVVRHDGPFRQWTNGNLEVLVEPTATGHRVRVRTMKGDSRALMTAGLSLLGAAAAVLGVGALAGDGGGVGSMAALLAAFGTGIFGAGALRLPGWARRRRAQIEEVLARLGREQPT